MYLSRLTLQNFRQFGSETGLGSLHLQFDPGVTGLVGRNDCGKSAVIDAIRYAFLTRDQEYLRVQPEDFHIGSDGKQADEILIRCELSDLSDGEKGAFVEYLSYIDSRVVLLVSWTAKRRGQPPARRWVDVSVRSGVDGTGPAFESSARDLLSSTYLRPLRDAAREMSPGRGSRLSQILANVPEIKEGSPFDDKSQPANPGEVGNLSLLGLADYLRHSVKHHKGVSKTQAALNTQYLSSLFLKNDSLSGTIDLAASGSDEIRLRQILERLELGLLDDSTRTARGFYGLGSNNLLYMACEMLLLGREPDGLPLLLIEEPEAHLHPQRQLRLMDFLTKAAAGNEQESRRPVQVIISTHSPNLASTIPLKNLTILNEGQAYPLEPDQTKLAADDYKFLERFLDVTKANLFFAHGVIVVEGDAEALLIPTLARLLDKDLTEHGISIVNVGGTGLRRFSRIFQRSEKDAPELAIPVACLTDMDVMPDCAPAILGLVEDDKRRWKAESDFGIGEARKQGLQGRRRELCGADGQHVRTFVADYWTLEYDLAFCGLAEEVYVAAKLAEHDRDINEGKTKLADVEKKAKNNFDEMDKGNRAELCSRIYKLFHSRNVSKAIAAQHLANALAKQKAEPAFDRSAFSGRLPPYIVNAIAYATGAKTEALPSPEVPPSEDLNG